MICSNLFRLAGFVSALTFIGSNASAFSLKINNGEFYGPGHAVYLETGSVGVNKFPDAEVRNIILTGPLTGVTPFFNNGAAEPNAIAEQLAKTGPVDGMASDGTLINENADTALRLYIKDPTTGELADLMVVAERSDTPDGGEPIRPDMFGNLTFSPDVVADPGDPSLISRFNPVFTTGYAEVPNSKKTAMGDSGGVDAAGPLASGTVLVGRLGDYDMDGLMDGTLVLAENAPLDLIVARGNPIAQIRPWTSDIPIAADQAIYLTLSGLLNNYPYAFQRAGERADLFAIQRHLTGLDEGVESVIGNMRRAIPELDLSTKWKKRQVILLREQLKDIKQQIAETSSKIDKSVIKKRKQKYRKKTQMHAVSWQIEHILFSLQSIAQELESFFGGSQ